MEEEGREAVTNHCAVLRVRINVLPAIRRTGERIDAADVVLYISQILRQHFLAVVVGIDDVGEELSSREIRRGSRRKIWFVRRVIHYALVRLAEEWRDSLDA